MGCIAMHNPVDEPFVLFDIIRSARHARVLGTWVCCAKTAEPVDMPFEGPTRMGIRLMVECRNLSPKELQSDPVDHGCDESRHNQFG